MLVALNESRVYVYLLAKNAIFHHESKTGITRSLLLISLIKQAYPKYGEYPERFREIKRKISPHF